MDTVEVELELDHQTVGHDGESLADEGASFDIAFLDVDPETPSKSGKYVKVGIAVASTLLLALGAGLGVGTMKNRNAQSKSVSALAKVSPSENALSFANGSSDGSRAGDPYDCGGKSGKSKGGYGYYGHGAGGKSDKSRKSGLSFVGEGFCLDSEQRAYDSVLFILAGIVETHPEDKEPNLLDLCEAKCKSPPSPNPNIEYYAAHGLVGVNSKNLFASDDIENFNANSVSSSLAEDVGLSNEITQEVDEQLGAFVDALKSANDDTSLSTKSAKSGSQFLVVSACFCDYTDDAISCDVGNEERGVAAIGVGTPECGDNLDCDDNNLCTDDYCDLGQQTCKFEPKSCGEDKTCDIFTGECEINQIIVPCVAVIDEWDSNDYSAEWSDFRSQYPKRPFCLLIPNDPNDPDFSYSLPDGFENDTVNNPDGTDRTVVAYVNRDDGNPDSASDWFEICGLGQFGPGSIDFIGHFIDVSGSMVFSTVRESAKLFAKNMECAGISFDLVFNSQERWVDPFLTSLEPPPGTSTNDLLGSPTGVGRATLRTNSCTITPVTTKSELVMVAP